MSKLDEIQRTDVDLGEIEEILEDGTISSVLDRPQENRLKRWMVLNGSRWHVSLVLVVGVFVSLIALSFVRPFEMRVLVTETNTVQMLFNTFLSGMILLVSIVVSINSIALSDELGAIGRQEDRVADSLDFRRNVEDVLDTDVAPAEPSKFLYIVLDTIRIRAGELRDETADNEVVSEQVETYVESVLENVEQVTKRLRSANTGTAQVVLAGLNYDYSWQIFAARRLQTRYADAFSEAETEALENMVGVLKYFATGHEYFKTLYYKREFASLSLALLYVSLPTIVFTSFVLLALDANLFPDVSVRGISPLLLYVSAAFSIALAPFTVLTAYILRAATVAKRTLAAGPFILQGSSTAGDIDWEDGDAE